MASDPIGCRKREEKRADDNKVMKAAYLPVRNSFRPTEMGQDLRL